MKKTFLLALLLGLITTTAFPQARTPLLRAFLQSNMDGNGKAGTNYGTIASTNFIDAATGLPLSFGGISTNFGVVGANGIVATTNASAGASVVTFVPGGALSNVVNLNSNWYKGSFTGVATNVNFWGAGTRFYLFTPDSSPEIGWVQQQADGTLQNSFNASSLTNIPSANLVGSIPAASVGTNLLTFRSIAAMIADTRSPVGSKATVTPTIGTNFSSGLAMTWGGGNFQKVLSGTYATNTGTVFDTSGGQWKRDQPQQGVWHMEWFGVYPQDGNYTYPPVFHDDTIAVSNCFWTIRSGVAATALADVKVIVPRFGVATRRIALTNMLNVTIEGEAGGFGQAWPGGPTWSYIGPTQVGDGAFQLELWNTMYCTVKGINFRSGTPWHSGAGSAGVTVTNFADGGILIDRTPGGLNSTRTKIHDCTFTSVGTNTAWTGVYISKYSTVNVEAMDVSGCQFLGGVNYTEPNYGNLGNGVAIRVGPSANSRIHEFRNNLIGLCRIGIWLESASGGAKIDRGYSTGADQLFVIQSATETVRISDWFDEESKQFLYANGHVVVRDSHIALGTVGNTRPTIEFLTGTLGVYDCEWDPDFTESRQVYYVSNIYSASLTSVGNKYPIFVSTNTPSLMISNIGFGQFQNGGISINDFTTQVAMNNIVWGASTFQRQWIDPVGRTNVSEIKLRDSTTFNVSPNEGRLLIGPVTSTGDNFAIQSPRVGLDVRWSDTTITNRHVWTDGGNHGDSYYTITANGGRQANIVLTETSQGPRLNIASGFARNDIAFTHGDLNIRGGPASSVFQIFGTNGTVYFPNTNTFTVTGAATFASTVGAVSYTGIGSALTFDDEAYDDAGWNGDTTAPTKNAIRDKIESLIIGGGSATNAVSILKTNGFNYGIEMTSLNVSNTATVTWTGFSNTGVGTLTASVAADSIAGAQLSIDSTAETEIEAVVDLQSLQGAVTDAQVPNNITIDAATLATTATTANSGDSATSFFPSGTLEDARLSVNVSLLGTDIDLSGAEATGILAAGRFPALTGDVTTSAGTLATTIGANSVALTTDTTGNYAAGDAEAGAALTGDSATSFFGTGTLEDARLSANVSLLGTDIDLSGSEATGTLAAGRFPALTGDVTTSAGNLATTIAANSVALATDTTGNYVADVAGTANEVTLSHTPGEGSTATVSLPATIDLGGKTSFEIPNAAAPTVDAFGEIAGDNNLWASGRGAPVFYDGTAAVALVGALVSDAPSAGQVPTWQTGGTITWETPISSGGSNVVNDGDDTFLTDPTGDNIVRGSQSLTDLYYPGGTVAGVNLDSGGLQLFNAAGDKGFDLGPTSTDITSPNSTAGIFVANDGTITFLGIVSGMTFDLLTVGAITTTNLGIFDTAGDHATYIKHGANLTENRTNTHTYADADRTYAWPNADGTIALEGTVGLSNKIVSLNGALGTDDTYTGTDIAGLNAGATVAQWETVYLSSGSEWVLADANGSGTYPAIGLAAAAGTDNNQMKVVVSGTIRNDAWNWTVGGAIYLSATPGAITQTAPSGSGDKVQVIGTALTADIIFLKVSSDYGTAP